MTARKRHATASQEDYLEAILMLEESSGAARINELAAIIGVGKSSASLSVKALCAKGLVEHDSYAQVHLTSAGRDIALAVKERHAMLRDFLVKTLSLPEDVAEDNACRMEHVLSSEVLSRIRSYIELRERCPHGSPEWVHGKGFVCRHIEGDSE